MREATRVASHRFPFSMAAIRRASLVIPARRRNTNTPTVIAAIKRSQCGLHAYGAASVVMMDRARFCDGRSFRPSGCTRSLFIRRRRNLTSWNCPLWSRTTKQASNSSTVQGGGKRRVVICRLAAKPSALRKRTAVLLNKGRVIPSEQYCYQTLRKSSGSLPIFAAIRRASSR